MVGSWIWMNLNIVMFWHLLSGLLMACNANQVSGKLQILINDFVTSRILIRSHIVDFLSKVQEADALFIGRVWLEKVRITPMGNESTNYLSHHKSHFIGENIHKAY